MVCLDRPTRKEEDRDSEAVDMVNLLPVGQRPVTLLFHW